MWTQTESLWAQEQGKLEQKGGLIHVEDMSIQYKI